MSSVSPELRQVACINTGSCDLAAGAETEKLVNFRPTKRQKVVQKAERDSLGVPREDSKDSLRFDRVVEAG
jgi:hypothetical protein